MGMVSVPPDVDVKGGGRKTGRVLKSDCFDIEMCELAAFGHLHPPVPPPLS